MLDYETFKRMSENSIRRFSRLVCVDFYSSVRMLLQSVDYSMISELQLGNEGCWLSEKSLLDLLYRTHSRGSFPREKNTPTSPFFRVSCKLSYPRHLGCQVPSLTAYLHSYHFISLRMDRKVVFSI